MELRKNGVKGFTRNAYVCPTTDEFGINIFKKCKYCQYFWDYTEYKKGEFNCYCCYPTKVNDRVNMHP